MVSKKGVCKRHQRERENTGVPGGGGTVSTEAWLLSRVLKDAQMFSGWKMWMDKGYARQKLPWIQRPVVRKCVTLSVSCLSCALTEA